MLIISYFSGFGIAEFYLLEKLYSESFSWQTHGSLIYAIYEWLRILQNTWWRGLHGGGLHAP